MFIIEKNTILQIKNKNLFFYLLVKGILDDLSKYCICYINIKNNIILN